jgi:hypothetical protein
MRSQRRFSDFPWRGRPTSASGRQRASWEPSAPGTLPRMLCERKRSSSLGTRTGKRAQMGRIETISQSVSDLEETELPLFPEKPGRLPQLPQIAWSVDGADDVTKEARRTKDNWAHQTYRQVVPDGVVGRARFGHSSEKLRRGKAPHCSQHFLAAPRRPPPNGCCTFPEAADQLQGWSSRIEGGDAANIGWTWPKAIQLLSVPSYSRMFMPVMPRFPAVANHSRPNH